MWWVHTSSCAWSVKSGIHQYKGTAPLFKHNYSDMWSSLDKAHTVKHAVLNIHLICTLCTVNTAEINLYYLFSSLKLQY